MEKIGLIAGNGRFPIIFAETAIQQGICVVAVAHQGETLPELEKIIESGGGKLHWIRVGQLNRMIRLFKASGVDQVVMAGGIKKTRLFSNVRPDLRTLKILSKIGQNKDDLLLRAVAKELESEGLAVKESTLFLSSIVAVKGPMTRRGPSDEEWEDIKFGWMIAKEVGRLEIGQCIVVKRRVVLAVEAIEGTDETIKRGGVLCRSGAVVIKVCKPQQDQRFDVPAIGPSTIDAMVECKASTLALEAGKTLLLDKEILLEKADRAEIAIVGVDYL